MILDTARKKINKFNSIGIHYEAMYHYMLRRRTNTADIYNQHYIDVIIAGLIIFDMQRFLGKTTSMEKRYFTECSSGKDTWARFLRQKLDKHRSFLWAIQKERLESVNLNCKFYRKRIVLLFDELAAKDNGLSRRKKENFPVGASKILHFLIPDLFIILDSNAQRELRKHHDRSFSSNNIDGKKYLEGMELYKQELHDWKKRGNDTDYQKLIALDLSWKQFCGCRPTPLPRIIDKCTFVGNKI